VTAEDKIKPALGCETAATGKPMRVPYLTPGGTLVIPFDSDPKYHWWKAGQSVEQTRAELLTQMQMESHSQKG
jgi:hypothetical protein